MAMTAEDRKKLEKQYRTMYNNIINRTGATVPPKLLNAAIAGSMTDTEFSNLIRMEDPQHFMTSTQATDRRSEIMALLRGAMPKGTKLEKLKFKSGGVTVGLEKMVQGYSTADPGKASLLAKIFQKYVMSQPEFQKAHPGFSDNGWWYKKNYSALMGKITDPLSWVTAYDADREEKRNEYQKVYGDLMGAGNKLSDEMLDTAWENNWDADSPDFLAMVQNQGGYAGGTYAQNKAKDFETKWKDMFAGMNVPVDKALQDAYTKTSQATNFDAFFNSTIKNSDVFKQAFPGYADWEAKEKVDKKLEEGQVAIWDYFGMRNDFVNDFQETFGPDKVPDQAIIDRAMREHWSTATYHNFIMTNDPAAKDTPTYQNKALGFDKYWKDIFGESSIPDQALKDQYMGSQSTDPAVMWDAIKQTSQFKTEYQDWQDFSMAQGAAGVNVQNDPGMYKDYQKGMEAAFAKIGMATPENFHQNFFKSGITPAQLQQNLENYDAGKIAYGVMSGQGADLQTAAGVGNKAAGGELQKRMKAAIDAHRAYANSKFGQYQQDRTAGGMTQNI